MDDPRTYDLSEFANEFTWGLMFWNSAEQTVKQIVAELLGGTTAVTLGLAMDMGNRMLPDTLRSAALSLEDDETRQHLEHLATGFERLLGYRNKYAHGLMGVSFGKTDKDHVVKLHGYVISLKGKGRLRAVQVPVRTSEIAEFKIHCIELSRYARAIMNGLVDDDWDLSGLLDIPQPSLDRPIWPETLKNIPHYLQ